MARYIDAEKVHDAIEAIQTSLGSNDDKIWRKNKLRYSGLAMARGVINDTPTADVVPKSEVEQIFEEIEKKVKSSITIHLEEINKEYIADTPLYDRHSGILFALQGMEDFIAELKKKYTEEKKNGN